jgi:energy-coupling factor transporter ATP-binding protein EcfA2
MRLHRLHAASFGAIREVDIEFGPGLNILYGPNDLGKSTLVAAIRLALLLPHSSTHSEQYVGWNSADEPRVELTFETEAQRIWRVKKVFGKSGSSLLQESKNGRDFDDVERGRKVDGKIREILRWGIPEPGGSGGGKGLPASFLATALLSTQADVSAVLEADLQGDPAASGKEQIAAALRAVAQDPIFVSLLRSVQAKRDEAYTDKGAKKTARGSIFKSAADRVNEARKEMEQLQKIVADSEGAERQLRDLSDLRSRKLDEFARATELVANVEKLETQAVDQASAAEEVRLAGEEVERIEKLGRDADTAASKLTELAKRTTSEEEALKTAQVRQAEADTALSVAEEAGRLEEADAGLNETVAKQQHELRVLALDRSAEDARKRVESIAAAQKLIEAAAKAARERDEQIAKTDAAREASSRTVGKQKTVEEDLLGCDLVERALEFQTAEKQAAGAQASVNSQTALQGRLDKISAERTALGVRRAALNVPSSSVLVPMRRFATDLATARGALAVGLVVTVTPYANLDLRVRKDQLKAEPIQTEKPLKIEAKTEVEIAIAEIASVRVRAGHQEAQEKAEALEERWRQEVLPVLTAAGVADVEGLDAKVTESRDLEAAIKAADTEIETLRTQIGGLAGAAEELREASRRAKAARAALGHVPLESFAKEIAKLGADAVAGLRKRRAQLAKELDGARAIANLASTELTLTAERARNAQSSFDAAIGARDTASKAFPEGVEAAMAAARKALAHAIAEKESIVDEISKLESNSAARKRRVETALTAARNNAEKAKALVAGAQQRLTTAIGNRALQDGQLIQLRKMRDAEDLGAARNKLQEATERHAKLPVPERIVSPEEVASARESAAGVKEDLETIARDFRGAQLVLEHVGGAVAREQLRDTTEAFELAEGYEREVEAEYESWKLLLEQMKEADAAQSSNLGQALAPFIASRFQELTQRRYENVQLTAQLGTDGVVAAGAVRSTSLISVGTREQLSTLYRLSLAEYLRTVIVLDDQLVQSDDSRMGWFRNLLAEKARSFQIVVVTCRPGDYLQLSELVPDGKALHADTDGFIRAVDLGRAVQRR